MGVCYTAILLDEHDWNYCDDKFKKNAIVESLNSHGSFHSAIAYGYGMILFECEKHCPELVKEELKGIDVIYDAIYFIADNALLSIFKS